jgi:Tol biopolymer transport system component
MSLKNSLRLGAVVIAATAATFALAASTSAQVVTGPTGPKATHIAFMSKADGEADIYAMTTNGVARTNLTDDKTVGMRVDSEPAWSPDGQYVVFQRTSLKPQGSRLYVVRTDGSSDPHALMPPSVTQTSEMDPYFAPNGRTIVFSSNRTGHFELYMVDATGGLAKQLTFTKNGVDNLDPAWSPNGLAIAFARHEWNTFGEMPSFPTDSIYVLWLRTGQTSRITNPGPGKSDGQPAWSGDSARIAFESNRAGTEDIYVADYKGNALRRITPLGSNEFHPTWASLGSQIALVSDRTGATEIYTLTIGPNLSSVPPMTQLTFDKAPKANPAWEREGLMGPTS